jgi:hypothetical protein
MRKTFCDKCGDECVNGVDRIYFTREHTTNQGEVVGQDSTDGSELCLTCGDAARKVLGLKPLTDPLMYDENDVPQAITDPVAARRIRQLASLPRPAPGD